eukprot:TRINITY_DN10783_c0_g1_i1.p1 TRINITY_DN10783_c0_g1~~TRINITY_DN10783_c0_g1_i1.p1  ORF type:complete len:256 (+),score=47.58 TRINITY_DN10783_c0_g1_i1:71-838(+)
MNKKDTKRNYMIAISIFLIALIGLIITFLTFPPLEKEDEGKLGIPRSLEQVKIMAKVLSKYKDTHFFSIALALCYLYLFMQTFCIPGTILISFMFGGLFGSGIGFLLATTMSTLGASSAYWLSYLIGRSLVNRFFPKQMDFFAQEVEKRRKNLLSYMMFVRLTPLLPNVFVNLASPIFNIPFSIYFLSIMIAGMPQSFIVVRTGVTLQKMSSANDHINIWNILSLCLLGVLCLIPTTKKFQTLMAKIFKKEKTKI